ncbi:MAG: hypothetical protein AMXMBFR13_26260 [Phycisphaerae bacterium]
MFRASWVLGVLLTWPAALQAEQVIEVLNEDFESGLDGWIFEHTPVVDAYPDVMNVFPAGGVGMHGPRDDSWGVWGGSQSVGQSSSVWDGTSDHWIQKQWPGALAPGTYTVTIEYDFYVYADVTTLCGGRWEVGNRVFLLTDEDYNFPCFEFNNNQNLQAPGFRVDFWPGYEEYATCQDVGGGDMRCVGPASGSGEQTCTFTSNCQNAGATPATWTYNGKWRRATWQATVTTTTGNLELRLLKHEKCGGHETVAWDDVDLVIKDQNQTTVFEFHDDFEGPDPLADWTQMVSCRSPLSNNDEPQIFATDDPLLYPNIDNPGSQSGGYSSNVPFKDKTDHAWMRQLFPNAVPAGVEMTMRLEFDWYVYFRLRNDGQTNDFPTVFPAPDGAGINGPNTGYPGSQSAGYASNLLEGSDRVSGTWIQRQFPAAVPPGTYEVTWEMDLYVYSEKTGDYAYGNRLYLLTDTAYDTPNWNWDGGMPAGSNGSFRISYWSKAPGQVTPVNGQWAHVVITRTVAGGTAFTTSTGNLELRLLAHDKEGGLETAAWDNLSLTITDPSQGGATVFSLTEDFEDGLDGWTAKYRTDNIPIDRFLDPWYLGNKVYVFTDDFYNVTDTGLFYNAQFQVARWPGDNDNTGSPDPNQPWNGKWWHKVVEMPFTSATGNVDVRLLTRQKYGGRPEVAAWDNVKLSFILPCNAIRFDADGDGDVDQEDFAAYQLCYSVAGLGAGCECFDADGDTDVDSNDLGAFEACASGPDIMADETCDDGTVLP